MSDSPLMSMVSAISTVAAIVAIIYARRTVSMARAANQIAQGSYRFQVLLPALSEYRSAEMLMAVRSLWNFSRNHPTDIEEAYRARRAKDLETLDTLRGDEQLSHLRTTLDFQRRLVSQFYAFLTSVYDEGSHQRKWIYTHWGKSDLEIIPKVIAPMERALGESIGSAASPIILDRLLRLYRDSPG